jgi:uncharacterized protein YjiS (DUF1127 family)
MNQIFVPRATGRLGARPPVALVPPASSLLARLVDTLALWHRRARDRHLLGELDDRLLGDIGISRGDAIHESDKPFWRG